ncbi:histidine phosphatase superfamily, partial [Lipomyces starkeyi]
LKRILVARHSTRLDTKDLSWRDSSPTPYDPPLAQSGILEAAALGRAIGTEIAASAAFSSSRPLTVYIHTSPFLRCAMTAHYIAQQLISMAPLSSSSASSTINLKIRVDSFLGEWLTPDYFASISPPPEDGHSSLATSSMSWLLSNGSGSILDLTWPLNAFGRSGEYGERWKTMYTRFSSGLTNLVASYDGPGTGDTVVILVTHGAGSNALVGALSGKPILVDFGLASLSVAVPR